MMVEAMIASTIMSLALVTLIPTFILSIKANKGAEQTRVGMQLSVELLEEIRIHKWDELSPIPPLAISSGGATLGAEAAETATDKRTFDDIDDFSGWTEKPPMDPMMNPLADFAGYTRNVTVQYVDASLVVSATPTDYKQVTVCTQPPKGRAICLSTLFTNH